jgi:His-Xaa-Ser system protein HxsD
VSSTSFDACDGLSVLLERFPRDGVFDHEAMLTIGTALYGTDAVFQACYTFTDRCFFQLSPGDGDAVTVFVRRKCEDDDLEDLVGEFANELLNQRIRIDLFRRTHALREMIVAQAFTEADLLDGGDG